MLSTQKYHEMLAQTKRTTFFFMCHMLKDLIYNSESEVKKLLSAVRKRIKNPGKVIYNCNLVCG